MHIEISRIGHDEDVEAIAADVQRVLRDVRESVEDWERMRQQVTEIVGELRDRPADGDLRPRRSNAAGPSSSGWPTTTSRSSATASTTSSARATTSSSAVFPGSGLGILRNDPDLAAVGKLPHEGRRDGPRSSTLLVLAKANSRATVHRPAYLDYVGVKTFDENGEVTGERRFLGLFSSAAYTESVWHVPLLREKAVDVLKTIGLDPRSHAGKALIDTLETYPRDELFHTPVDELASMASRVMETRGRRQLRIFVRRDTYGRYVSVLVFLPRDRYNTNVRERFSEILKESFAGESIEFTVRMSESTTARVHFVVHPAKGEKIPDVDVSDLERRLTDASRSWRDDFTAATIAEFGEDVGSRLARSFEGSFPEAYKEDFSAATGALDLGRLEALGDVRHRPVAVLRRSTPRGARLGSRSSAAAPRSRCRRCCRRCRRWASRSSTSGPTSSTTPTTRRTSTSSACATRPACPTRCASPSRTRSGPSGTATTRSTASTRWCSAPG